MDAIAVLKIVDWFKKAFENYIARMNAANFFDATLETVFLILMGFVLLFVIFQTFAALLQSTIEVFKIVADFFIKLLKWGSILFGVILLLWFLLNADRKCLFKFEDKITRCHYIEKTKPASTSKKEDKSKVSPSKK